MTTEEFLAKHKGHRMSGMPYIAPGGWDARILECEEPECHHDYIAQVRAIPAEGCLIDPDPHLVLS